MMNYTNSTTELSRNQMDTAIISVGATEQCGPYLPLHLDTLVAEQYAIAYGKVLNAYVLPTLPFNTSEEHASFKGTVTVSPNILSTMLEEIIVNLTRQGFKKFVLCNGHGGAYWESSFIKHINFKYPDIILIHPHHNREAWDIATHIAGLEGNNELHGGLLSVCTAMWLCPDLVKLHSMGSEIPPANIQFLDFMGWEKLTTDGCWGMFNIGEFTNEELALKGKVFWESFINHKCEGLKEILLEAYSKKTNQNLY